MSEQPFEPKRDPWRNIFFVVCAAIFLCIWVMVIIFYLVDNKPTATVITSEVTTSRDGIPYVKDCIEGVEYVIIAKGFHNAAMAITGRSC